MKIIFLDIDGVLCTTGYYKQYDFETYRQKLNLNSVRLFNQIVEHSGAKVVLSSTWRLGNDYKYNRTLYHFYKYGVRCQFIGKTKTYLNILKSYNLKIEHKLTRGYEIAEWLYEAKTIKNLNIESIVILDDDSDMACLSSRLIKICGTKGLQRKDVIGAVEILNNNITNV